MSAEEIVIEEYLQWFLRTTFAKATLDIASSAIQVFMWFYSLSIYLKSKPEERRKRDPFLFISLVILCLSVAASTIGGYSVYNILLDIVRGPEHASDGFRAAAQRLDQVWLKGDLLWNIAIWIADGLLVYRCYIVWYDRVWVSIPVLALYLTGVAISIRNHIPLSYYDQKSTKGVDTLLLVLLNVVIAALISARLVRAHRRMAKLSPLAKSTEYLSVVTILVESAAPLALMGIPLAITLFMKTDPTAWRIAEVLETTFKAFAILSPQMIIFRVATGTSWANSREGSRVVSAEIHFAGGEGEKNAFTDSSESGTSMEFSEVFASHLSSATEVETSRKHQAKHSQDSIA